MANNVWCVLSVILSKDDNRVNRAVSVVKSVASDVVREKRLYDNNDPDSWVGMNKCADNDSFVEIFAHFVTSWNSPKKEAILLSKVFKGCDVYLDVDCIETGLDIVYNYKNGELISQFK